MKIKTTFVVLFLVIFVLLFALCTKGKVSSPLENARLANEGFRRCLHFVEGWLFYRDQENRLIPRNLSRDRDIWNAKDCAADNYPLMVLTTMITGKDSLYPVMLQMLEAERSLTSRIGSLPDDFSFSGKGFVYKEPDIHRILFGASEYIKDGLLPLTEWMGKSPWRGRMFELLDDQWKHAPVETSNGAI